MAFIATYISTTTTSELSSYFQEIAEFTTAEHETFILKSYYALNGYLDAHIPVPIQKEPTSGLVPELVKIAQAMIAIWLARTNRHGADNEKSVAARTIAMSSIDDIIKAKSQFEYMYSPDEIGIGLPIPGSSNTSVPQLLIDRSRSYSGDREQTYTVTITTAGAIGTAVYSWADGEGNTTTGVVSSYSWTALENNIYIRFMTTGSTTLVLANTWTIRGVPLTTLATTSSDSLSTIPARL